MVLAFPLTKDMMLYGGHACMLSKCDHKKTLLYICVDVPIITNNARHRNGRPC
jgi:hypothetical protein